MKAVCVIALLLSAAPRAYGAASHGDHDGPSTSVANPDLARVEQFRPQLPHHPEKLVPILVVICALFAAAIPVGICMRSRAPEPAPNPATTTPPTGMATATTEPAGNSNRHPPCLALPCPHRLTSGAR